MERIKQKLTLQEALDLAMKKAGENIQDIQIFTKDYRKIWIESRYDGYRVYESNPKYKE